MNRTYETSLAGRKLRQFLATATWLQLLAAAVSLFWLATVGVCFIDLAVAKWLGDLWRYLGAESLPALFPNRILGGPLLVVQCLAASLLVFSGVKLGRDIGGVGGLVLGTLLVSAVSSLCFALYALLLTAAQFAQL